MKDKIKKTTTKKNNSEIIVFTLHLLLLSLNKLYHKYYYTNYVIK